MQVYSQGMRVLLVESLLMKSPQSLQKVYYFVSKSQKLITILLQIYQYNSSSN